MANNESSGGANRRVKGPSTVKDPGLPIPSQDPSAQLQMFRSLAEHSLEFIGICDLQFKPFFVNEAGMKLVGLDSLEEACAVRVQDFFFPEDQRYISEDFFPTVLREGRAEVEIRFRHFKTGATLWMIYNVFQVRDAEGRVNGYATVSRNITERKQAEEALQSAALFPEENPFPVLRVNSGGKLLFANRSAGGLLAMWGCAVGDRVPEIEEAVRTALEAGGAQELEISVSERIVSFVLMPIVERGYVNLYGRDVTEQKRAQAELRKSEERFYGLFEDDLTGDFICTAEGRIVLCNPAFARIFGFPSVQEALGTNMRNLYLEPEERGTLLALVKRDRKVEFFEGWRKRRDGTPIHIVENLVGHFNEADELIEIKGYIHDDTNERAEEELRGSEERYRELVEGAVDGIFVADAEGRYVDVNPAGCAMLGMTREEVLRSTFTDLLLPEEHPRLPEAIASLADGKVHLSEWRFRRKDGSVLVGELSGRQLPDGRLQVIVRDATDRKRAERLGILENVFQEAPSFLHVLRGPDFVFEFANEAYHRLVGRRELIGRPAFEVMPEAAAGGYPEMIARVMTTKEPFSGRELPVTLARTAGAPAEERLIDLVYLPLVEPDGTCVRVLGHGTDVTEMVQARKRIEEAARQKAEELEAVLDAVPVAVWIAQDRECRVITGNAYADELIMATARGGNISKSAPSGEAAVTYRVFRDGVELEAEDLPAQRAAATGKLVPAFEMELVFPTGRRLTLMAGAVPLFDHERNVRSAIVAGFDVTPLKKAQEAAREERDFSTAVLETAGALVVVLDTSGQIKRFNRACAALTGYAEEDVLGQPVWSLVPPEDLAGVREEWSRLSSGTLRSQHENHWMAKDGTRRLITWANTVLLGANGEIQNVIGTGLDITEQRQAEEALKESEARMARAQAIAYLGSWELDTRNNELTWSDEVYRIFGFEPQSFRPSYEAFLEAVHPEDRAAVDARYSASLREGKNGYEMEHRIVRAGTGEIRIVLEKCEHLRDVSSQVIRSQGMVHDITERKLAEEALERSQARLTQAVRVAGLGIFEHDHLTDVIDFSPLMQQLLGFDPDEKVTIAAIIQKVVPEDREKLAAKIARAHDPAGDGHFDVDYRVHDRSGVLRWVSARSQTFFSGEGSERRAVRTIGAALDVTERKESEARLEHLVAERTARLQELVGELEHFSYTITHDLKSPLRAMRGFSEVVQQMGVEPEAKPFLEKICTAAERMDRLIADALSYSRSVRQDLPLEDVDTEALLRGILDSYPQFQPWKAQIRVEGKLPVVLGNEAGLTQCFSNLLGNAVKFVKPEEKPEIRVWASEVPAHGRHSEWVRIWVEDKGIGISKEMLPRVFEMFSRGSKKYEGTGIGLALVRKVVQRMGGKVGVESEEGKGSRFWIELGRVEASAVFSPDIARQPGSAREGTVLYVEDEQSDAMFMERAFAEKGLTEKLRVVDTGRVAIDYLSGSGEFADRQKYPVPSLVLLDLNLPQVSGFGVLEWIRNHPDYKRLPVVVFSSSTREDDEAKARNLGANDFISKPSSGMEFGRVVEGLRAKWME